MNCKWTSCTLGDVTFEVTDRAKNANEELPVYGVDRSKGLTTEGRVQSNDISKYKVISPGMFAYNPMRLNIGSIGFSNGLFSKGLVSPDYVVFGCKDGLVDPRYLNYFIETQSWKDWVASAGTGSVRIRIYYSELARMPVSYPEITEQVRIVDALSLFDKKVAILQQMNATLELISATLFKSWFIDFDPVYAKQAGKPPLGMDAVTASLFPDSFQQSEFGLVPKGWTSGSLIDMFVLQRGFDLPAGERLAGNFPIIAASGPSGTHNVAMAKGPGVVTGRSGVIGRVFLELGDYWPLNTALWIKEFKGATPCYSFELLRRLDLNSLNAGSAVPTLNRNHVHALRCLIPDIKCVNAFEDAAIKLHKRIHANNLQLQSLSEIRNTLLPRLISGQMRLPKNDELFANAA